MPETHRVRLSVRPIDAYYVGRVEDDVLRQLREASGPGRVAVDAGCGWGEKTDALRRLGFTSIGVEHDPSRVAAARSNYPSCRFVEASVERLPLGTASADVLFSNSVLQYVDLDTTLAEYARVLKPGARLVLIENLRHNPIALAARTAYRLGLVRYGRYMTPRQHVTPRAAAVLRAHGFEVDDVQVYNLLAPLRLAMLGMADTLGWKALRRLAPSEPTLARADAALLRRLPALRPLCWTMYVSARRVADAPSPPLPVRAPVTLAAAHG